MFTLYAWRQLAAHCTESCWPLCHACKCDVWSEYLTHGMTMLMQSAPRAAPARNHTRALHPYCALLVSCRCAPTWSCRQERQAAPHPARQQPSVRQPQPQQPVSGARSAWLLCWSGRDHAWRYACRRTQCRTSASSSPQILHGCMRPSLYCSVPHTKPCALGLQHEQLLRRGGLSFKLTARDTWPNKHCCQWRLSATTC